MGASGFEIHSNVSHLKHPVFSLSTSYSYSCAHLTRDAEGQLEAGLGSCQSLKAAHGTVFRV